MCLNFALVNKWYSSSFEMNLNYFLGYAGGTQIFLSLNKSLKLNCSEEGGSVKNLGICIKMKF